MAGTGQSSGQLSKQMNQYFNQDGQYHFTLSQPPSHGLHVSGGEGAKYEASEESLAADKVDKEEAVEELCDTATSSDPAQPPEPETAGVPAN